MKQKLLALILSAFLNAFILTELQSAMNDSALYIHGTVVTVEGDSFTGQIRWGKEEAFWFDHFNSTKPDNDNLDYLSRSELAALDDDRSDRRWYHRYWSWSSYGINDHTHSFACEFGDIESLRPGRGDRVLVTLRNGEVLRLDGGSNDVGATISIHDDEVGLIRLDWEDLDLISFANAPVGMESAFGDPLYGTVHTYAGTFTGYVQWDHDERLSSDELNGRSSGGKLDIPFSKIKVISKTRGGVEVEMLSGREFDLTGSNDVDSRNRGIIVNISGMGRVDIPWEEFEKVVFMETPATPTVAVREQTISKLSGTVTTLDGKRYSGEMVYDLDEAYDLEILDGMDKDVAYLLPFRHVKSIKPQNRNACLISMANGQKITLRNKVDVSDDNDGILIGDLNDDPVYIPWSEVEEVVIN